MQIFTAEDFKTSFEKKLILVSRPTSRIYIAPHFIVVFGIAARSLPTLVVPTYYISASFEIFISQTAGRVKKRQK